MDFWAKFSFISLSLLNPLMFIMSDLWSCAIQIKEYLSSRYKGWGEKP